MGLKLFLSRDLTVTNLHAAYPSQANMAGRPDWNELDKRSTAANSNNSIKLISGLFFAPRYAAELARLCRSAFQIPFFFLKMLEQRDVIRADARINLHTISLVYRCILQRHIESIEIVEQHTKNHSSLSDLIDFLFFSPEWKSRSVELFLRAFPDKERVWHPHIPKTAGSSFFSAAYQSGASYFNTNILEGASSLTEIGSAFRIACNPLLISGHFPVHQFENVIGSFDQIVTFVRDPLERAKSMFQYSRDVVDGSDRVHKADPTPLFASGFVYDSFEQSFENGFFPPNLQCAFITPLSTCCGALNTASRMGFEIGSVNDVDDAIRQVLRGPAIVRENVSQSTDIEQPLSPDLVARFTACNAEDEMLFRVVRSRPANIRLENWTATQENTLASGGAARLLRKLKRLF